MSKTLTYLFDPLCGWCYGINRALAALVEDTGVNLALLPSGLFCGNGARMMDDGMAGHVWTNDHRIEALTGAPFSTAYREQVLTDRSQPLDSTLTLLALTAVAESDPGQEFAVLQYLQRARYVDGRDITSPQGLVPLLEALGMASAASALDQAAGGLRDTLVQRIETARMLMQAHSARGIPGFIVNDGDGLQRALPASLLIAQPMHFARQVRGITEEELDNLL